MLLLYACICMYTDEEKKLSTSSNTPNGDSAYRLSLSDWAGEGNEGRVATLPVTNRPTEAIKAALCVPKRKSRCIYRKSSSRKDAAQFG